MRKLIIIGILMLVMAPLAGATDTVLDTLEYKENKMIAITGNVTLPVSTSPDISLLFRLYDPASNITIYSVQSNEIIYDYTFVNDTKNYTFIGNDNKTYIICIDFSSIEVPPGIDAIIAGYEAIIENLTANYTALEGELEYLRGVLNQSLRDFEAEQNKTAPLLDKLANLTADITEYEMAYMSLDSERQHYEAKYKEYSDPFVMFPSDGFYFNIPTAIVSVIVVFIVLFLLKNFLGLNVLNISKRGKKHAYDSISEKDARGMFIDD